MEHTDIPNLVFFPLLPPTKEEVNVIAGKHQRSHLPPPLSVFVCLSVSQITQKRVHLDEILHVDRCRDMNEVINF